MKTLVICDTSGMLIAQWPEPYTIPAGVPCIEVEIPAGKYILRVDVSVTPNVPVYADLPKSEAVTRLELLEKVVNELTLA